MIDLIIIIFFIIFIKINKKTNGRNIKDSKACKDFKYMDKELIIIGDIHGDYKALVEILQKERIIDDNNEFLKNDKKIIQLGDMVNKGKNSYKSLKLLQYVQKKSENNNVIRLIGNHELMFLQNNYRYSKSEIDRKNLKNIKELIETDILNGSLKSCYNINNLIFSHAGITDYCINELSLKNKTINEVSDYINNRMKHFVKNNLLKDNRFNNILIDSHGIFWFRKNNEAKNFLNSNKYLQFIGHTIKNYIQPSKDLSAIYTDIGMYNNDKISYLIIKNNKILIKNKKNKMWVIENFLDKYCN